MKENSKTTNAANLICHQGGQRTVNGIVGNTRRGIQVDQTLDPDSNNPVANKPVSAALAALAGKIDAALQKPTGLTKTKLVGVGASGQENIEIGDNLTLANGKLSAAGGGGKNVPPTLNLIDMETEDVRTSITQEEKDNLEKGLYNQVLYPDGTAFCYFMPSKMLGDKLLDVNTFVQFYFDTNTGSITSLALYGFSIGEKDTNGNYPITIEKQLDIPIGSGGSASIPTLETRRNFIGDDDTLYSDADIELIKNQENNFINLPIGYSNNVANTLCFVVKNKADSSGNSYILTAVGGWAVAFVSSYSSASAFITWNANITTKKLTNQQFISLSRDNTSLYVQDVKIFLTDTLTAQNPVNVLHNSYTLDTINGKPIIHSDNTVNRYTIPTITFEG